MRIKLHKNFEKGYKKLTPGQKKKFKDRRTLFMQDEFNPILNNHALKGKYRGFRSINVTGDLRVIFTKKGEDAVFVTVDNHSNLYG